MERRQCGELISIDEEIVEDRKGVVARIPEIFLEDNAKKMADDIARICSPSPSHPHTGTATQ